MPEVSPVSPITAERPPLGNIEGLRGLNRTDVLGLSLALTARLNSTREAGSVKREDEHYDQDIVFLKAKAAGQKRRLNLNELLEKDDDHLWVAAQILLPPKEAEIAYQIIRIAEFTALGIKLPFNPSSRDIYKELKKNRDLLFQLNDRQIINGPNASLNLLERVLQEKRAEKAGYGKTRRRFFQVAALGTAALAAKLAFDNSPIQTKTTEPESKMTSAAKPSKNKTPEATRVSNLTPEPTPKSPDDLFLEFIRPFIEDALRKRAERARKDSEYSHRIDDELNQNRINIALLGYGEEHEESYSDFVGPITILSYDLKTNKIASISFSRDMRAPELEDRSNKQKAVPIRYSFRNAAKKNPDRIDVREGFEMLRKVAEDATGLAIDFQIVFKDTVIHDLIRDVAGNALEVDVPKEQDTNYFRFNGRDYPPAHFDKGKQRMDSMRAMNFILGEHAAAQTPEDERTFRKNLLMQELFKKIISRAKTNPLEIANAGRFFLSKISEQTIFLDLDQNLLVNSLNGIVNAAAKYFLSPSRKEMAIPELDEEMQININDPIFGGEGVKRVHNINEKDHPAMLEDYKKGVMKEWMLVPPGGNPYGDIVNEYWQPVRNIVKEKLCNGSGIVKEIVIASD